VVPVFESLSELFQDTCVFRIIGSILQFVRRAKAPELPVVVLEDIAALVGLVLAFLGVSIHYVIKAAGGEELQVFAQNTDGSEPEGLAVGRDVQLVWKPEHTFVVERG